QIGHRAGQIGPGPGQPGVDGGRGAGVGAGELDQKGGRAAVQDPHGAAHRKGRTSIRAPASALRTARAISTAPGESPCTQIVSAVTATVEPSIAVTVPASTMRTMRAAISPGSASTAPGSVRGTSRPSGV